MILSIDIGRKNLGYTMIKGDSLDSLTIDFNIFTIDDKKIKDDIVAYRCKKLLEFFKKFKDLKYIIIERQVPTNVIAMGLMYSITSFALQFVPPDNIIIFDPKLKFTTLKEKYSTKNSEHKLKSIEYAKFFLSRNYPEKYKIFNTFSKQDDIADSLNQALIWMFMAGKFDMDLDTFHGYMVKKILKP